MQTDSASPDQALREWIRANEVCWEISPRYEVRGQARRQVGFDLTLFAKRPPSCTLDPGCPACAQAHEQLRRIALAVLPPGDPYEVEPFDAAFHLRPENRWEPEVDVVVAVLHEAPPEGAGAGGHDPAKPVATALSHLGAQPRVWPR